MLGTITLLAQLILLYLSEMVIEKMTCVGSLLIIALALNMMKVSKFKVINYVVAIFSLVVIYLLYKYLYVIRNIYFVLYKPSEYRLKSIFRRFIYFYWIK